MHTVSEWSILSLRIYCRMCSLHFDALIGSLRLVLEPFVWAVSLVRFLKTFRWKLLTIIRMYYSFRRSWRDGFHKVYYMLPAVTTGDSMYFESWCAVIVFSLFTFCRYVRRGRRTNQTMVSGSYPVWRVAFQVGFPTLRNDRFTCIISATFASCLTSYR